MSLPSAPPPAYEEHDSSTTTPSHPIYPGNEGSIYRPPHVNATAIYQILPNKPTTAICHVCKETVTTKVRYSNGTFTYVMTFLCGLFFLCCCIPLCCRGFKDVNHFCPKCGAFIGMNKRI